IATGDHEKVESVYLPPVFTTPPEKPPQTIICVPVQIAVWPVRADGAFNVVIRPHDARPTFNRPPSLRGLFPASTPPQTSITPSAESHTAVCCERADGPPAVGVAVQEFPTGSYRPPVLNVAPKSPPPQTSIRVPVHSAVWE